MALDIVNKVVKLLPSLTRSYRSVKKLMRRLRHRVDTVYIDRGPWLERGLRDLRIGFIHERFGKRSYVEREFLEIKNLLRKMRRSFQSVKSMFLFFKGYEVYRNYFKKHLSLGAIPALRN